MTRTSAGPPAPRRSRHPLRAIAVGALVSLGVAAAPPDTGQREPAPVLPSRPELPDQRGRVAEYRRQVIHALTFVMGDLPPPSRRVPLDVRIVRRDTLARYTRTLLSFAAEPGDRPDAYLLIPLGLRHRVPAVLCLHEAGAHGMEEAAGVAGHPDMDYGAELAERGFVTLCLDDPNFGSYRCDAQALGYVSTTMKGIWNRIRAVDLLVSLPEVDARRIGSIGHSMDGQEALLHAVFDTRIRTVVSSCGFTSLRRYSGGNLASWSTPQYMPRIAELFGNDAARMPFGFTDVLAMIAPRRVLVMAALEDRIFPVEGVRECVGRAGEVYRLLGVKDHLDAVYFDGFHHFPEPARRIAYDWIERRLKG